MQVLLSSIGTRGDVQPIVALALELQALGHRARLCVPPNFKEWVESYGLECIPIGPDLSKYYYDAARGLLFLNVAQDIPNATGPSPLGSCTGAADDPNCPRKLKGLNFYACPAAGCVDYKVQLNDATYEPGPSKCEP